MVELAKQQSSDLAKVNRSSKTKEDLLKAYQDNMDPTNPKSHSDDVKKRSEDFLNEMYNINAIYMKK